MKKTTEIKKNPKTIGIFNGTRRTSSDNPYYRMKAKNIAETSLVVDKIERDIENEADRRRRAECIHFQGKSSGHCGGLGIWS